MSGALDGITTASGVWSATMLSTYSVTTYRCQASDAGAYGPLVPGLTSAVWASAAIASAINAVRVESHRGERSFPET